MTKFQLFSLLVNQGIAYVSVSGVNGHLVSVEREDGSGRSFILTILSDGVCRKVFLRTID